MRNIWIRAQLIARGLYEQSTKSSHIISLTVLLGCVLILSGATIYGATRASFYYATNSDALVDNYVIGEGLTRHQADIPDQHSNLLKLPIFFLENRLPFHYKVFLIVNIALSLITILGWCGLLIIILGKKYAKILLLTMSAFVAGSAVLNYDIAYTTVRNIEFPISLLFIMGLGSIVSRRTMTRRYWWLVGVATALFSVVLASDTYFAYAVSLPVLIVIIWLYLQSGISSRRILLIGGAVIASSGAAELIKAVLQASGVFTFGHALDFKTTTISEGGLAPSITTVGKQLLELHGATVFNEPINGAHLSLFINFLVLIVGCTGFFLMAIKTNAQFRESRKSINKQTFIWAVLAVAFFVTPLVYIFSAQAVLPVAGGQWISGGQERYLTFSVFLVVAGFAWVMKTYYAQRRILYLVIPIVLLVSIASGHRVAALGYIQPDMMSKELEASFTSVASILQQQHVKYAVTGYWFGPTIQFWTNGTVQYVPVTACNQKLPFLTRKAWYVPQRRMSTALVVDRGWVNESVFWSCSDQDIVSMYGVPERKINATSYIDGTVQVWIYNYDVRQRIQP